MKKLIVCALLVAGATASFAQTEAKKPAQKMDSKKEERKMDKADKKMDKADKKMDQAASADKKADKKMDKKMDKKEAAKK